MVPVRDDESDRSTGPSGGGVGLSPIAENAPKRFIILNRTLLSIGGGVLLLVAIFVIPESEKFQTCFRERKHHHGYHAIYEQGSVRVRSIVRLKLNAGCALGDTDALTVEGAIVLAFATVTLWLSTERLWKVARDQLTADRDARLIEQTHNASALRVAQDAANAAKTSADAALGIELPQLELNEVMPFAPSMIQSIQETNIRLKFTNFGRTPAYLIEYGLHWTTDDFLPEFMRADLKNIRQWELGQACRADDSVYLNLSEIINFPPAEIEDVLAQNKVLKLFGFCAYRDFQNSFWITKFCLQLRVKRKGVYFVADTAYADYNKRENYDPAKRMHIRQHWILAHAKTEDGFDESPAPDI